MSNIFSTRRNLAKSQAGMVAIFVTMIMMIVISLLVLGFAQISRHEQRSSLDTQLSTQAYYAAESGINDAKAAIQQQLTLGPTVADKTGCADVAPYTFNAAPASKSTLASGVSYSCVLINANPTVLTYNNVGTNGVVIPLISTQASNFDKITIKWTPASGQAASPLSNCPATALNNFPNVNNWNCKFALLRTDLVEATSLKRATWQANTRTNFFEPVNASGGGTSSVPFGSDGQVVPVSCTSATPGECSMTITTSLNSHKYYLHVNALYRTVSSLTVTGILSDGSAAQFSGAQAIVDVTGKAQDTLRRVAVTVGLTDANVGTNANAAIISGDSVCKQFSVTSNGYFSVAGTLPGGNGNPLCTAQTVGSP
jgi:Tfp pilus assembly protein PilX